MRNGKKSEIAIDIQVIREFAREMMSNRASKVYDIRKGFQVKEARVHSNAKETKSGKNKLRRIITFMS